MLTGKGKVEIENLMACQLHAIIVSLLVTSV